MNALPASLAAHLPVVTGLMIGTLAKYGLDLDDGQRILPPKVLGHLMMLALLGLLAEAAGDLANAPPQARVLAGAGAALLSARLVRAYRRWCGEEVDRRLPTTTATNDEAAK